MPNASAGILMVDDDPAIRMSMSLVLTSLGYRVRSAVEGFSALREISQEMPDILLSDLNMPGMSGFELLSVVRRRFPAIQTIAMSGAFYGSEVPEGVPADSFFQKGSGMDSLLNAITTFSNRQRLARTEAPIWISQNGRDSSGEPYITMACPECLRGYPLALRNPISRINETDCIYCGVSIQYAIAAAHNV